MNIDMEAVTTSMLYGRLSSENKLNKLVSQKKISIYVLCCEDVTYAPQYRLYPIQFGSVEYDQ